jgi:membrane fusion protein, multidrug efflux system
MALKKLPTVVTALGIAAALALAYWVQNRSPAGPGNATAAAPAQAPGGRPAGPGGAAVMVEVGTVQSVRIEDDVQAVGTLRARQGVMLRPEVSGRISRLGFADGQRIRRGQVLVQLDDSLQRAQLQQAKAQAAIAQTNLKRNRELLAQGFVSQSAVDQAAANLEVAQAQVSVAQAQLKRMAITAPFDGAVGIRNVNVGDYVKDGTDLVSVEDTASMWVDFRLPESVLPRLKTGQSVSASLDAMPGREFKGQVDAVDAQLDANGRALLVRARLPNADGALKSGMFARVRTVFAVREGALVVPEEALVPQGDKQYLVKVVGGKSQRIEARVGLRKPGRVEVLDGLAAGDVVVTAGQARLMRGDPQPVQVVEVGRPPAAAASAPAATPGPAAPRG